MKKIIAFSFLILFATFSKSQNWQWAKSIHSFDAEKAYVSCIDLQGNSYVIGAFGGVQNCVFENDTLTSGGYTTSYIAKYSSTGNLIWAKITGYSFSATCRSGLTKLVYDSLSNSLLFAGAIGNYFQMNSTTVTSSLGNMDAIFGKVDLNGDIVWHQTISGVGMQSGNTINYDNVGNVYAVGTSNTQIKIGNDTLTRGVFMIKYNSNGNQISAKNITSSLDFLYLDLNFTSTNFYISGVTTDTLNIDTIQYANTNLDGILISKFNLNMDVLWAKLSGNFYIGNNGFRSAVDLNNNIFTIYTFQDSAVINGSKINAIGARDIILIKHDSLGNYMWHIQADYSISNSTIWGAYDITSDKVGNLYITGTFGGTAHFGNNTITSSNPSAMFLAKYSNNGDCIGVDHFGNAKGLSVVVDNNNNPIVSGTFENTVTIGSTSFTCSGVYDAFVAKHAPITDIKTIAKTSNNQLFIHANPNTGKCNITLPADVMNENNLVLSIYNNQGSLIQKIAVNTSEQKIKINLEAEAAGIYTAVLSGGSKSYSGKIVFE